MGQVIVEMGRAEFRGVGVIAGRDNQVEEINAGASSSATTISSTKGGFASVINNSVDDIWVMFGPNPTASVGQGHFIPSGKIRDFGGLLAGDKVAVINDA